MAEIIQALNVSVLHSLASIKALQHEWEQLHQNCSYPSIYNSFNYLYFATEAFDNESHDELFYVVMRETTNEKLIALFPFKITKFKWHRFKFRGLVYAGLHESDKPYPVILAEHEELAWNNFKQLIELKKYCWQFLELVEVPDGLFAQDFLPTVFAPPKYIYRALADAKSPILNLQEPWDEFYQKHPKMRKKIRKMESDFSDSFRFEVFSDNENAEEHFLEYLDLESRSRKKAAKIGITRSPASINFYRELFTQLAKKNQLFFGFIYCKDKLVSGEIAYACGNQVYFCHGCYDMDFANYSPGMVSTSLFIRTFYNGKYQQGDFLGGFAQYINPWSDRIVDSTHISLCKVTPKILLAYGFGVLAKWTVAPLRLIKERMMVKSSHRTAEKNSVDSE